MDDVTDIFDDYPPLRVVAPFVDLAGQLPWFRALGEVMSRDTVALAENYVQALGFPEAVPALLGDWLDAAAAAESLDYNSPAWEAEEMERAVLTHQLLDEVGEEVLEMVFAHVAQAVMEPVSLAAEEAATYLQIHDEAFLQAATGAAVHACHLAVLALMTSAADDHPFLLRFSMFEAGRWPLGILGGSLNIF